MTTPDTTANLFSDHDPEEFEALYLAELDRNVRQNLLEIKLEDDPLTRVEKLGAIFCQHNPRENAELLIQAYQLSLEFSPIGEACLLAALQLDVIADRHGVIILQGIFDELQVQQQSRLCRLLFYNLVFRDNTEVLIRAVDVFYQLIQGLYLRLDQDLFKKTLPDIIQIVQELLTKNGLQIIRLNLPEFFDSFFEVQIAAENYEVIVPLLVRQHFRHRENDCFELHLNDLMPSNYSPILLPGRVNSHFDFFEWEQTLDEDTTGYQDDIVIEARRKFEHLRTGERVEIARKVRGIDLKLLIYDKSPIVMAAILENPQLTELEVCTIASRRTTSAVILDVIADNHHWFARYPVKNSLVKNPNTTHQTYLKMLPFILQEDLIDLVQRSEIGWRKRRAAYFQIEVNLTNEPLADLLELARHAHPVVAEVLFRSRDERLLNALFYHDRLTERQVLDLIGWPEISPIILERIGTHHFWAEFHSVRLALCHHPQTPSATKLDLLDDLSTIELQVLKYRPEMSDDFQKVIENHILQHQVYGESV